MCLWHDALPFFAGRDRITHAYFFDAEKKERGESQLMKNRRKGIAGVLAAVIAFAGAASRSPQARMIVRELAGSGISLRENTKQKDAGTYQKNSAENTGGIPDLSSLSASKSQSVIKVNGDSPYFKASDKAKKPFISLSEKDSLGRCRQAKMCAYYTGVASKERGDISSVH